MSLLAAACGGTTGGGSTASVIQSFSAASASIAAGQTVQLTATFSSGTGTIDHNVGAVQSGVPVTVTPGENTTYTLVVTTADSKTFSSSTTVLVTGAACIGKTLLSGLAKTKLMTGFSDNDNDTTTPAAASWDLSYRYLSGGLFAGSSPCTTCNSSCSASGQFWWGCFDGRAPGDYALDRFSSGGPIPWFTYYEILQSSGAQEGGPEIQALNNASFTPRILSDLRFLFQTIGSKTAFVHVEPDFWGYAQQLNADPTKIAVQVSGFSDCAGQPDTLVGFVHCVIGMARKYSPNVRIGFHASSFATGTDVNINTNAALDVAGEAKKLTTFFKALGADAGDFIVVDALDRDAGYYQTVRNDGGAHFWDPANLKLPTFHQHFTWVSALAENLGLPVFYWQVPIGNASQNNTTDHYKDNRVDYFYAHPDELAAAHVAGMLFGAGGAAQTLATTDGGNLYAKEKAYLTAGGQALCQ